MRKSFFKVEKRKKPLIGFSIHYFIRGINTYLSVSTKNELNLLRKEYNSKRRKKAISNTTGYGNGEGLIPLNKYKPPAPEKQKITIDDWYRSRHDEDFYVIEHHLLKFFTKNKKRQRFMNANGALVWEQQVVKFFLVPSNYDITWLQEDKRIQSAILKKPLKVRGGKKVLVLIPHFVLRDKRVAFDFPLIGFQEISSGEIEQYWNIGIDREEILLKDIPALVSSNKKYDFMKELKRKEKLTRQKEIETQKQISEAKKKILLPCFQYHSLAAKSGGRSGRNKSDKDEKRISGKIDSSLRKLRAKHYADALVVMAEINTSNKFKEYKK